MYGNAKRIREVRDQGLQIEVEHIRRIRAPRENCATLASLDPCGGETIVHIYKPFEVNPKRGEILARGVATCHENDNYDRKLGLCIALNRAIKKLQTPIKVHEVVGPEEAAAVLERVAEVTL